MKKIMIVGSPGSGKSTLSRQLAEILGYKVLHLDYIFHIDNVLNIGREKLKEKTRDFALANKTFIIDGNYGGTMAYRMQFCDTIIFFDLPTDICVENVMKRQQLEKRPDMAPGFDVSIMDDNFLEYVKDFRESKIQEIEDNITDNKHLTVIRLTSYKDKEEFLKNLGG